jgi:hypothetical protein
VSRCTEEIDLSSATACTASCHVTNRIRFYHLRCHCHDITTATAATTTFSNSNVGSVDVV